MPQEHFLYLPARESTAQGTGCNNLQRICIAVVGELGPHAACQEHACQRCQHTVMMKYDDLDLVHVQACHPGRPLIACRWQRSLFLPLYNW